MVLFGYVPLRNGKPMRMPRSATVYCSEKMAAQYSPQGEAEPVYLDTRVAGEDTE